MGVGWGEVKQGPRPFPRKVGVEGRLHGSFCSTYYIPCNSAGSNKRGISSNGRAPASHAGGSGIDARILHSSFSFTKFVLLLPFLPLVV